MATTEETAKGAKGAKEGEEAALHASGSAGVSPALGDRPLARSAARKGI